MAYGIYREISLFFYQHVGMNILFVYPQVSDQSMLSETGVSQMPVITYFICKNRSRDFLQCFYVWIVFYYNSSKQNLVYRLWLC